MIYGDDEATTVRWPSSWRAKIRRKRGMMYISQKFEIHGPTEYKLQNGVHDTGRDGTGHRLMSVMYIIHFIRDSQAH